MTLELDVYREGRRWFFDDDSKGIEHEEFVAGVPELIYNLCQNWSAKRVHAKVSDKEFEGAEPLHFVALESGGVTYCYQDEVYGWFCPVFWKYFDQAPEILWATVEEI